MSASFYVACDSCDEARSAVFCHSDGCFLCSSCDAAVHSTKITQRHARCVYTSCPAWAYQEAKSKGRVLLAVEGIPEHDEFALLDDGCWGSSTPMAIDDTPFPGRTLQELASHPSSGATGHSAAHENPCSPSNQPQSSSDHASLTEHSSRLAHAPAFVLQRASSAATLLPQPELQPLPLVETFHLGELNDVADLMPSRRSFDGMSANCVVQGSGCGDDGHNEVHGHSNNLETLLQEFCDMTDAPHPHHEQDDDHIMILGDTCTTDSGLRSAPIPLMMSPFSHQEVPQSVSHPAPPHGSPHGSFHHLGSNPRSGSLSGSLKTQGPAFPHPLPATVPSTHHPLGDQRLDSRPHQHRGLLSAAFASGANNGSALLSQQHQRQQQQQSELQQQQQEQCLPMQNLIMASEPSSGMRLQDSLDFPFQQQRFGPEATSEVLSAQQHSYHPFDNGTLGYTFSAPPEPNMLSASCNSPGDSMHGSGTAMYAAAGMGISQQNRNFLGASLHGAALYGGETAHRNYNHVGAKYLNDMHPSASSRDVRYSQQGFGHTQGVFSHSQQQQEQQHMLQQPPAPSLSRVCSQQILQAHIRQPTGETTSHEREKSGPMYDSMLNGSMRGANLFATAIQSQQQQMQQLQRQSHPLGNKRGPDVVSAPVPPRGSRGIVLDLGDRPPATIGSASGLLSSSQPGLLGLSRLGSQLSLRSSLGGVGEQSLLSSGGCVDGGSGHGRSLAQSALSDRPSGSRPATFEVLTRIQRPDGSYRELHPDRVVQLHRYRLKRMQRLKAFAEGQRKIRYEYRKTIADSRPRVKGRFVKECTPGLPLQEDPSGTDHRPDQRLMSSLEGERLPVSEDPSTHGGSSSLNTAAAAAQLRYAMSEINLEAVALALSKSRKLSGGAASGCHPPTIHRRSLMSSSTVITDRELDELGKSLGSPFKSNQAPLAYRTSSLNNSEDTSESLSLGGTTSGESGTPPTRLYYSSVTENTGAAAGRNDGGVFGYGVKDRGGAGGLLDSILSDSFDPTMSIS